jgi:hypothetical protein
MTRIRSLNRWTLFVVPVLLAAVIPASAQDPARGKKYALLVAVDRYEKGSLLPGLPFPRRDVEDLATLFLGAGYDKDNLVVMTKERGVEDFDLSWSMPAAMNFWRSRKAARAGSPCRPRLLRLTRSRPFSLVRKRKSRGKMPTWAAATASSFTT